MALGYLRCQLSFSFAPGSRGHQYLSEYLYSSTSQKTLAGKTSLLMAALDQKCCDTWLTVLCLLRERKYGESTSWAERTVDIRFENANRRQSDELELKRTRTCCWSPWIENSEAVHRSRWKVDREDLGSIEVLQNRVIHMLEGKEEFAAAVHN